MWKDFKEFAFQGNVLDLAIAVVIGAAFGQIINSLVENIIMPLIGGVFGGIHFEGIAYQIGDSTVEIGMFIQSIFDFFVIAASVFMFVRIFMKIKRKQKEAEEEIYPQEALLIEIRDLLAEKNKHN